MRKKDIQAIVKALLAEIQNVPITLNVSFGRFDPFIGVETTACFVTDTRKRKKAKRK